MLTLTLSRWPGDHFLYGAVSTAGEGEVAVIPFLRPQLLDW